MKKLLAAIMIAAAAFAAGHAATMATLDIQTDGLDAGAVKNKGIDFLKARESDK